MNKLGGSAEIPGNKAAPSRSARYRAPGRPGLEQSDVDQAADELLRTGQRPSVEKIRARVGGSPNTIAPLLDAWWSRLAGRVAAGPDALARLPESVAQAAEALYIRALDAARIRAEQELATSKEALTQDQQLTEARRHVLSLREGELEQRLAERNQMLAILNETVRYERGQRRKLELVNKNLQLRLQVLEANSKRPSGAASAIKPSSLAKKKPRPRKPLRLASRQRSR